MVMRTCILDLGYQECHFEGHKYLVWGLVLEQTWPKAARLPPLKGEQPTRQSPFFLAALGGNFYLSHIIRSRLLLLLLFPHRLSSSLPFNIDR
jgi:hypothetical protein